MSQINFAALIDEVPQLRTAWVYLQAWFEKHPRIKFVDLGRLAKEIPQVESVALTLAMKELVDRQLLRPVFRFRDPDGHLGDEDFPTPNAIPDRVSSRFGTHSFNCADGDIVPGFRLEKKGA